MSKAKIDLGLLASANEAYEKDLPEDKLQRIIALASRMEAQDAAMKLAEDELAAAKAAYMKTERETLPDLMNELELPSITLPSGAVVKVAADATAKIPEKHHAAAMKWLNDNKFGGLIKTFVKVSFGKGERDKAVDAVKLMAENGLKPELGEGVHHSTLKSFVKEQINEGKPLPMDIFGVHTFNKATIKKK